MSSAEDVDAGLLAPMWAGTPVQALTSDAAWVRAMLRAEAELSLAAADIGLVDTSAAMAVAGAAATLTVDVAALATDARASGNPVVPLVSALRAAVGETHAAAVHPGATSQDIMDTASMLVCRAALDSIDRDVTACLDALAALADEHRGSVAAARTLTQYAVPTTFGARAAGWLVALCDARTRLRQLTLPVQLGGAAATMAATVSVSDETVARALIPAFAQRLGLADPVLPWHTARAPVRRIGEAAAEVAGMLGKIGLDVQTGCRTEIGELSEPRAPGRGGSSAMPHKRNPVLSTLIVAAARQIGGPSATLAAALLAADERPAGDWHAEWAALRETLRLSGGAAHTAAELCAGLEVHSERMRENVLAHQGDLLAEQRKLGGEGDYLGLTATFVDRALAHYRRAR